MGKGDNYRPVNKALYDREHDRIFPPKPRMTQQEREEWENAKGVLRSQLVLFDDDD